jgi:hypothetical protein
MGKLVHYFELEPNDGSGCELWFCRICGRRVQVVRENFGYKEYPLVLGNINIPHVGISNRKPSRKEDFGLYLSDSMIEEINKADLILDEFLKARPGLFDHFIT